jgi:glutathione S-transferase
MEHKELQYQYIEVDPYKKSPSLLAINPLGLIPAMQHGSFKCHESTVLLEYLEDAFVDCPLLPSTAQDRAHARLWADHVNKKIIPAFYHTLQAQDTDAQAANAAELKEHLGKLVGAAHPEGPFFAGAQLGWVDVQLAPWLLRFSRVLGPYRGWPAPEAGSRWARWVDAVETNEHVRNTTSTDELYKDSYERYAENRPETSQVADAVNSGRGLP